MIITKTTTKQLSPFHVQSQVKRVLLKHHIMKACEGCGGKLTPETNHQLRLNKTVHNAVTKHWLKSHRD